MLGRGSGSVGNYGLKKFGGCFLPCASCSISSLELTFPKDAKNKKEKEGEGVRETIL